MSQGPHATIANAIAMAIEPTLRAIVREELTRILSGPVAATEPEPKPASDITKDGRLRPIPGQRRRQAPVPKSGPLSGDDVHHWLLKEHNIVLGRDRLATAMKSGAIKGATWDAKGSSRGNGIWRCDRNAAREWAKSLNLEQSKKGYWRTPKRGRTRAASASKGERS